MRLRVVLRSLACSALTASLWAQGPETQLGDPLTALAIEAPARPPHGQLPQRTRTTTFRGRQLSYVVIDGMAVHAGDIVLGRAEDIESAPRRPKPAQSRTLRQPMRRNLAPTQSQNLWPEGVMPYVIDSDVSDQQYQDIQAAIAEWNDKTVIELWERDAEPHYVRFSNVTSGYCRSSVGTVGGEQKISLPAYGCDVDTVVHEIGHAVGLRHEHQREDREEYLMVLYDNLDKAGQDHFLAEHPGDGPYDYASTMHYSRGGVSSNGGSVLETIPPGMGIPAGGLSPGDIDGVAKLYGKPSETTSIASNPPGLAVVIDGAQVTTPATVRWASGTTHIIEVPVVQTRDGRRFLFGRWNDGGQRRRTVTAGPETTWLEANFIEQHSVGAAVQPAGAGSVTLSPPSPDGFYTVGTQLQAVATPRPGSGYRFVRWGGTLGGHHGRASNSATWVVGRTGKRFEARFTTRPILRIEANVEPFVLRIDDYYDHVEDYWTYAPVALETDVRNDVIQLGLDEVGLAPHAGLRRHRYEGWSDGGAISHSVRLPRGDGLLTAKLVAEHPLSTKVAPPAAGRIVVDPAPHDRYYNAGTPVYLRAEPSPSWEFVRWIGDVDGREAATTIRMDRPMFAAAVFSQAPELAPGSTEAVVLPGSNYSFRVYDKALGFRVHVPPGASELSINFEPSTPGADVGLFVTAGAEHLDWRYGEDGQTPDFRADFQSRTPGSSRTIVITRASSPALVAGSAYHVSLVVFAPSTEVRGALTATTESLTSTRPAAGASPRALTFVSPSNLDPAPQVIRLTNKGAGQLRFSISSDQTWLSALPANGALASGAGTEIEVRVLGAGTWPETHYGNLAIVPVMEGAEGSPVIESVPVTFVVMPASDN